MNRLIYTLFLFFYFSSELLACRLWAVISKSGYSFYEVKEAIYKPISVLQFSTITFTILDSEGDLVEFSLEGDQLTNKGDDKKKHPTLLNLHIRQRAINRSS